MGAKVTVERLIPPVYEGDWHDPPSRWIVIGPGDERARFSKRSWADLYAKLRRASPDRQAAEDRFVRES